MVRTKKSDSGQDSEECDKRERWEVVINLDLKLKGDVPNRAITETLLDHYEDDRAFTSTYPFYLNEHPKALVRRVK